MQVLTRTVVARSIAFTISRTRIVLNVGVWVVMLPKSGITRTHMKCKVPVGQYECGAINRIASIMLTISDKDRRQRYVRMRITCEFERICMTPRSCNKEDLSDDRHRLFRGVHCRVKIILEQRLYTGDLAAVRILLRQPFVSVNILMTETTTRRTAQRRCCHLQRCNSR